MKRITGMPMKFKYLLKKNVKVFGISGIISSWFTIGTVWAGLATLPLIGFVVTGGLFALAMLGIKN